MKDCIVFFHGYRLSTRWVSSMFFFGTPKINDLLGPFIIWNVTFRVHVLRRAQSKLVGGGVGGARSVWQISFFFFGTDNLCFPYKPAKKHREKHPWCVLENTSQGGFRHFFWAGGGGENVFVSGPEETLQVLQRFQQKKQKTNVSSDQNLGYLLYIRDYTPQLYRDYKAITRIPINQPVFHGMWNVDQGFWAKNLTVVTWKNRQDLTWLPVLMPLTRLRPCCRTGPRFLVFLAGPKRWKEPSLQLVNDKRVGILVRSKKNELVREGEVFCLLKRSEVAFLLDDNASWNDCFRMNLGFWGTTKDMIENMQKELRKAADKKVRMFHQPFCCSILGFGSGNCQA